MEYVTIEFEVDAELYEAANAIITKQGYTMEAVIVTFLESVVACGGIPFPYEKEVKKNDICNV